MIFSEKMIDRLAIYNDTNMDQCEFDYNVSLLAKHAKHSKARPMIAMLRMRSMQNNPSYCDRNSCTIQLKNRKQGRPISHVKKFTKDPNMINDYQKHMRETMKNLGDDKSPMEKMKIVAKLWKEKKRLD